MINKVYFSCITPINPVTPGLIPISHITQITIETRKFWANIVLFAGVLLWSLLVSAIRAAKFSALFGISNEIIVSLFDAYLPAMLLEGLVRCIPFGIKAICRWVRFKAQSHIDHYTVQWVSFLARIPNDGVRKYRSQFYLVC